MTRRRSPRELERSIEDLTTGSDAVVACTGGSTDPHPTDVVYVLTRDGSTEMTLQELRNRYTSYTLLTYFATLTDEDVETVEVRT